MRGRKPKPSYLRVLDGNAGKRPVNVDEPQIAHALEEFPPPAWLSEDQKRDWRYAMQHAPPGMLRSLDQSTLTVWVVAQDTHRKAAEQVAKHGSIVKTKDGAGFYQNPFLSVQNKQASLMLKAAAELGFTPSSRSRVKVDRTKKPGAASPFADLKSLADDD